MPSARPNRRVLAKVARLYNQGRTYKQIGAAVHYTPRHVATMLRWAEEAGISVNRRRPNGVRWTKPHTIYGPEDVCKVARLYNEGKRYREIAREIGCCEGHVSHLLYRSERLGFTVKWKRRGKQRRVV